MYKNSNYVANCYSSWVATKTEQLNKVAMFTQRDLLFELVVFHSIDTLAQREKRFVDLASFFYSHPTSSRLTGPLSTCQVHYGHSTIVCVCVCVIIHLDTIQ